MFIVVLKTRKKNTGFISRIKKEWSLLSSYVAPINNHSHFLKIESSKNFDALFGPHCFFVPNLCNKNGIKFLKLLILKRGIQKIACIGQNFTAINISYKIRELFPKVQNNYFLNSSSEFMNSEYDAIIVSEFSKNMPELLRNFMVGSNNYKDIILEGSSDNGMVPLKNLEDSTPMIICAYPWAGTGRFLYGFNYLMEKLKWKSSFYSPTFCNKKFIVSLSKKNTSHKDITLYVDSSFQTRVRTLDYFEYIHTHEYFTLASLNNVSYKKIILMRDPRDIINSFYWYSLNESQDKENHIYNVMDGFYFIRGHDNAFVWPNINLIMDNYLFALSDKNCIIIKFEDLHKNALEEFKELFTKLHMFPNALISLTENDFNHAVHLGSFHHQTAGRLKRGQKHYWELHKHKPISSCRKGIVGDWRSSFTQKAIEYFKHLTGDKLIQLGYEKDLNW